MENSISIGDGLPTPLVSAEDALKVEQALTRFDRLSMPAIRITGTDGNVETVRLGQADKVSVSRGAVDEDTVARVRKELDQLGVPGVIDVAANWPLDTSYLFKGQSDA